jgi:hypothetical protein
VRVDVGAAELAGGGRRHCARVGEEWRIGEEQRGTSERSDATLGEEGCVGDWLIAS